MINLEQLIVAFIFLVPGFISTAAEKTFQPRRFDSAYSMTISSLLRSISLNILGLAVVAVLSFAGILVPGIWALNVDLVGDYLKSIPLSTALFYVLALYVVSAGWGALLGIYPNLTFREFANKLNLTSKGRHDSVWARIKDEQRPVERPCTWIKIHLDDDKLLFGRLRHASSIVEQDKPIEMFLKPVYEILDGDLFSISTREKEADGIYLKLGEAHRVEFYFTSKELPVSFKLES